MHEAGGSAVYKAGLAGRDRRGQVAVDDEARHGGAVTLLAGAVRRSAPVGIIDDEPSLERDVVGERQAIEQCDPWRPFGWHLAEVGEANAVGRAAGTAIGRAGVTNITDSAVSNSMASAPEVRLAPGYRGYPPGVHGSGFPG